MLWGLEGVVKFCVLGVRFGDCLRFGVEILEPIFKKHVSFAKMTCTSPLHSPAQNQKP